MIKVIYHKGCQDGFGAAWVAWRYYGKNRHELLANSESVEFIPKAYGEPPPEIHPGDIVYILDFSYSREVLLEMNKKANSLVVLDHHKSAQEDLEGLDFCIFDMNQSGAMLAWNHFFPSEETPWLIEYIQDRDLWNWKLAYSKEINACIASWEHDNFEIWEHAAFPDEEDRFLDLVIAEGRAILRFVDQYTDKACTQLCRQVRFLGHPDIPVVNVPYMRVSDTLHTLHEMYPEAPFVAAWFQRGDGFYQYSLRSKKDFDVSELAVSQGGGGHAQAAGFQLQKALPL